METDSLAEMGREMGYAPDWRPSRLLAALRDLDRPLEEKVAFALRCFGWTGEDRPVPEEAACPFESGARFLARFHRLRLPCKVRASGSGSQLWLHASPGTAAAAEVSARFGEAVVPIGTERCFDGYEEENPPDCWENTAVSPDALDFDEMYLFLGERGRVYWYCYDGDSMGVAADSLLEFFAVRFSLMEDRHLGDVPALRSPAGEEDR